MINVFMFYTSVMSTIVTGVDRNHRLQHEQTSFKDGGSHSDVCNARSHYVSAVAFACDP